jgi:acyl-CoA synthetase (NDP forming)
LSSLSSLRRLLAPLTIAVVGANESLGMSNNAVRPMLAAGRTVHLVNPKREELYGQTAFPSLTAIGEPVDAVLGLVNAARAVDLVAEAGAPGCGGVVVTAAGFGEGGPEGEALQRQLVDAAVSGGIAVVGPNCAGLRNVPLGANLFTGGPLDLEVGGVAVVSQSGFLVRAAMAAARDRQLGVSIAVSSGNEAVCDLADYVQVLATDEGTSVICLVIETIRRPDEFFAAVAAARAAGKSVVALKLGRGNRARRIIASHTGAIADDAWVYDVAFADHGIVSVADIDHLLDAALLFAQVPPTRRPEPIRRIGIITTSGGVAALATDIADRVDAPVPPLDELEAWVRERVPGDTVNPLDLTGFVMTDRALTEELFERYADAVDLLVLAWWTGEQDEGWASLLLEPFAAVAGRHHVPFVVSPVESTSVGSWVAAWRKQDVHFARGIESIYRAVAAHNVEALAPERPPPGAKRGGPAPSGRPSLVPSDVGPMVPFSEAMGLLTDVGIAVADHVLVRPADEVPDLRHLGDSVVVKLADVPHRTELGAVSVGVPIEDVADEVSRLRAVAEQHHVPADVVVQAMVHGVGEAFGGLLCTASLGPVLLFGRGGVQVETDGGVRGRMLPTTASGISSLVDDVAGAHVFERLRGQAAWPTGPLETVVASLVELWQRHGAWLDSVDLNPLIVTPDGPVAVDVLLIATDPEGSS